MSLAGCVVIKKSVFIPVNPVYFKLIIRKMPYGIDYPQHSIRKTHNERRLSKFFLELFGLFALMFV